jgi:hypothetical protein
MEEGEAETVMGTEIVAEVGTGVRPLGVEQEPTEIAPHRLLGPTSQLKRGEHTEAYGNVKGRGYWSMKAKQQIRAQFCRRWKGIGHHLKGQLGQMQLRSFHKTKIC